MAHGPIIPGNGRGTGATGGGTVRVHRFPWWILLIIGILTIVAAVGLIAFPWAPVGMLSIIIGVGLIASGLSTAALQRGAGGTVSGILLVVLGVFAIIFAEVLSEVIVTMLAVGLLFVGALLLVFAIRTGGSPLILTPAVITLLAGIVTLVWPTVALTVVAVIVGLMMMATGFFLIRQSLALRKLPPTIVQG